MDDATYPNDGEFFDTFYPMQETEEQAQGRQYQREKVRANQDFIQSIVNRLQARIAFYSSINSINDDVLTDEQAFRIAVAANKQTASNLELEKNYWQTMLKNNR